MQVIIDMAVQAVKAEKRRARDCASAIEDFTDSVNGTGPEEQLIAALDLIHTLGEAQQEFSQRMAIGSRKVIDVIGSANGIGVEIGPEGMHIVRVDDDGNATPMDDPDTTPSGKAEIEGINLDLDLPEAA